MIWIWPDWLPHTKRDPEIPICDLVMDVLPRWQDLWKPNYPKGPSPGSLGWGFEDCTIGYEPITFQAFIDHTVFRFRNPTEAYFALKRIQKDPLFSIFIPDKSNIVEVIDYISPIADEYYLRCSDYDGPRCGVFARYDEYISVFYIAVPPGTHTFPEIEEFIKSIDDVFQEHLQ